MMLKLKAYNCDATPNKIEMMRSSIYRLVNIVGDDGKIIYIAGGYPKKLWDTYLEEQIDKFNLSLNAEILVVNDIALELVNQLIIKGFHNFVIAATDCTLLQKVNNSVNIVYYYDKEIINIETTLVENLETMNRNFDLIISNPPFDLGSDITISIIKNVSFKEFINIMPISEYEKCIYKGTTIANFERDYIQIPKQESMKLFDCACPPLEIGLLSNQIINNYSKVERLVIKNNFLNKFYILNKNRPATFEVKSHILNNGRFGVKEHTAAFCPDSLNILNNDFYNSTIVFGMYFISNGVHADEGDAMDNYWNYKSNSIQDFQNKVNELKAAPDFHGLIFNNSDSNINYISKIKCSKWMREGKLYSYILKQVDNAGTIDIIKDVIIPHVDWTREWTDEQILQEFGYTEEEIKEILYEA